MKRDDKIVLLLIAIGFLLAVGIAVVDRVLGVGFPDWAKYVWPTSIMMIGLSGHASASALISIVALSAFLNGAIYGIITWLFIRLRRAVVRQS